MKCDFDPKRYHKCSTPPPSPRFFCFFFSTQNAHIIPNIFSIFWLIIDGDFDPKWWHECSRPLPHRCSRPPPPSFSRWPYFYAPTSRFAAGCIRLPRDPKGEGKGLGHSSLKKYIHPPARGAGRIHHKKKAKFNGEPLAKL